MVDSSVSMVSICRSCTEEISFFVDDDDDDVLPDVSVAGDALLLIISSTFVSANVTRKTEFSFKYSVTDSAVKLPATVICIVIGGLGSSFLKLAFGVKMLEASALKIINARFDSISPLRSLSSKLLPRIARYSTGC